MSTSPVDEHHGGIPLDTVGMRLYIARKQARVSQRQAAIRVGVSYTTWQSWENDVRAPRVDEMQAISHALSCDLRWLNEGGPLVPAEPTLKVSREQDAAGQGPFSARFSGSDMDALLAAVTPHQRAIA